MSFKSFDQFLSSSNLILSKGKTRRVRVEKWNSQGREMDHSGESKCHKISVTIISKFLISMAFSGQFGIPENEGDIILFLIRDCTIGYQDGVRKKNTVQEFFFWQKRLLKTAGIPCCSFVTRGKNR